MFKIIKAKDMGTVLDFEMEGVKEEEVAPFITALVLEKERTEYDDPEYMRCEILNVISDDENMTYGKLPAFGDYMSFNKDLTTTVKDERDFSKAELEEAKAWKERFDTYHKSTPFRVHGSFFNDKPVFDGWDKEHTFPRYAHVDDIDVTCPPYVDSINKAELWLLNNYPEYYMGCTISQDCRGGSFIATAIPCTEYPKGQFESYTGRITYAMDKAKELYNKLPENEREKFSENIGIIRHDMTGTRVEDERLMEYQEMYWSNREMDAYRRTEELCEEAVYGHAIKKGTLNDRADKMTREKSNEVKIPGKDKPENHLDKNYVIIWQRDYRDEFSFVDAQHLKSRGIEVKREDFTPVYVGAYERVRDLDDVYDTFQNDTPGTPEDYKARSLSVGDVITLNNEGVEKSYLVDTFGFKKIDDFTQGMYLVNGVVHERPSMTRMETDIYEDQYGLDLDGNEKIGKEAAPADAGDRDLNGNGVADKYDKNREDDDPYGAR